MGGETIEIKHIRMTETIKFYIVITLVTVVTRCQELGSGQSPDTETATEFCTRGDCIIPEYYDDYDPGIKPVNDFCDKELCKVFKYMQILQLSSC